VKKRKARTWRGFVAVRNGRLDHVCIDVDGMLWKTLLDNERLTSRDIPVRIVELLPRASAHKRRTRALPKEDRDGR